LENFSHVKSPKLLDSPYVKYSTIVSGYSPEADGPHWIRLNPKVNRP